MTNKVLVTYRCPRKGAATSRHLSATLTPDNRGVGHYRVVFSGGPYGTHTIKTDNLQRVNAHWRGYVAAAHARAKPRGVTKAVWWEHLQAHGYTGCQ